MLDILYLRVAQSDILHVRSANEPPTSPSCSSSRWAAAGGSVDEPGLGVCRVGSSGQSAYREEELHEGGDPGLVRGGSVTRSPIPLASCPSQQNLGTDASLLLVGIGEIAPHGAWSRPADSAARRGCVHRLGHRRALPRGGRRRSRRGGVEQPGRRGGRRPLRLCSTARHAGLRATALLFVQRAAGRRGGGDAPRSSSERS